MADAGGASFDPDQPVGPVLARMRRARKLTGGQLGRLVGMSQPKISRLENGIGLPDPQDVRAVARALGADEALVNQLTDQAERSQNRMTDWRPVPVALAGRQRSIGQQEAEARAFRVFQPAVVVGLLQTSEYARSVLTSFQRLITEEGSGIPANAVPEAVSARVQRQEVLADRTKEFHFVMTEAVLSNRICPPEDMPAQIRRLRELSRQDNISIGIIPAETPLRQPPFHGFALLDDHLVSVDLFNTGLSSTGRADARLYRRVFDDFEAQAEWDIDPILDRYQNMYLDMSRRVDEHPRGTA
ncbi:MAG TPA: helix-turn-helix transcriptional regulator [Actinoplanes sp.]|nr:helix-turn-helix transcriptional regulator [Actinoplanes sp.]